MPDAIKFSQKAYFKLISVYFKKISTNWILSTIAWIIDSKYRKYKRLDYFLKEQLTNPDPNLVEQANNFKKFSYNRRIVEILKFVRSQVKYKTDTINWGKSEYWASAIETLTREKDDCDGINALIYILARLSGVPAFVIYCVIGDVGIGGHFWCVYLDPKSAKVYPIDGTYKVSLTHIPARKEFNSTDYKKVWYIFNDELILKPIDTI